MSPNKIHQYEDYLRLTDFDLDGIILRKGYFEKMKFVRFKTNGGPVRPGELCGDMIRYLSDDFMRSYSPTEIYVPLADAELMIPVIPGKILCVGMNYCEDDDERKRLKTEISPCFFSKFSDVCTPHGGAIKLNRISSDTHFEGELAVVIGKTCRNVPESEADKFIFGYSCADDVSAGDIQSSDGQWTRGKNFDSFFPFGPCIATDIDPDCIHIRSRINGKPVQDSSTSKMIRTCRELVSYISRTLTLYPGDVISTGTPQGVCSLKKGDIVEIEIENIGVLRNIVTE